MNQFRTAPFLITATLFLGSIGTARAQTSGTPAGPLARVSAIERLAEKRTAVEAAWHSTRVGEPLKIDDFFRTGKRSKADIKFADGSLLRLGQLSSVEFRSAKGVQLLGGQLLFAALRPGRVLAGTAAAEIKGSVGIITLNDDGSSDFVLYSGAMDVVTPTARVSLPVGKQVTARADGALSALRAAAPLAFAGGQLHNNLTSRPTNTPFVGSEANVAARLTTTRHSADDNVDRDKHEKLKGKGKEGSGSSNSNSGSNSGSGSSGSGNSGNGGGPGSPGGPGGGNSGSGNSGNGNSGDDNSGEGNAGDDRVGAFTGNALRANAAPAIVENADGLLGSMVRLRNIATENVTETQARTYDVSSSTARDIATATAHLREANFGRGQSIGGDLAVVGAVGDGGTNAVGGLIHGYAAKGDFFFDIELLPLRVHSEGMSEDFSAISSANVTYRAKKVEVQAGRQRFLEGPVQASLYGSMVRAGSREVMDAVRIEPKIGEAKKLEFAYLIDAFPRNLPYRVGGSQSGFYARYAMRKKSFSVGINALKYTTASLSNSPGATVDFAIPLAHDQIEFYGEFGRDPFRRGMTTFGLNFPGLYQKTDFDVYLEYARLTASSSSDRPPIELALRVYRRLSQNASLVGALSRFYGTDTSFTLGLAFGTDTQQ